MTATERSEQPGEPDPSNSDGGQTDSDSRPSVAGQPKHQPRNESAHGLSVGERRFKIGGELKEYVDEETAGGVVLVIGTLLGLLWANFGADSYATFWHWHPSINLGGLEEIALGHWVNDGLMAVFFFVVGMEIKRELVVGELRDPRKAALPVIAALGGMLLPALLYNRVTLGTAEAAVQSGWAIPVATDIAFVLGIMALLGPRVPPSLKVFILTLAIADDVGGILIIALVYTESISIGYLVLAGVAIAAGVIAQRRGKAFPLVLLIPIGLAVWYFTFKSGVHATIAGVLLGLLTPTGVVNGRRVLKEIEDRLHPWSAYFIIPIFAVANTGIVLSGDSITNAFGGSLAWGVVLGLVVGKLVGIAGFTLAGKYLRMGVLADTITLRHLIGGAALAGIGFTVALFIAELNFDSGSDSPAEVATSEELLSEAKIGILTASIVAAALGSAVLVVGKPVDLSIEPRSAEPEATIPE